MRAPRWPKIGIGSSIVACCCELASKTVRSPPPGRAEPNDSVGLGSAPAVTRSARAMSASRSAASTRGLRATSFRTSSRVTAAGGCAHAAAGKSKRLSSLIELLGSFVLLGGEDVVDRRQDEERDDQRRPHPADDPQRERPLRLAADVLRQRHWQQAE